MSAGPIDEMARRIGEIQPRLPSGTSLSIGLAALIAVAFPPTWMFVRYFTVMAHEGSHAVVGSLWGFKIKGVRLFWKDAAGETEPDGEGNLVPPLLVGYFGPSLFGLAAAKLISIGHSIAVLWLTLVMLVVLLALVKNVFGLVTILIAGVVIYDFARYGTVTHQTMAAYGIAWLLLLSGVRGVLRRWDRSDDAAQLAARTKIVPLTFAQIWLVGAIFAVFVGARLMM
jgi:hypothetical protein